MAKTEKPVNAEIRYPTGCDLLDLVVGGEKGKLGYPSGKIINVVGDKSSGKTFLAFELIAAAHYTHKDNFRWVYDDCESGASINSKNLYGFDIIPDDPELAVRSRTVEDMSCNVRKFIRSLKKDEFGIYVVDSLDGLSSEELEEMAEERQNAFEKDKDFTKGSYQMGAAKFLSQEFFRTLTAEVEDKNCLIVLISQLRDNVGAGLYAPKSKRAGGRALDFYAHTVLWLTTLEKIEKKDRIIGVVINAETKKSKTPRPFRDCIFSILFDYGVDSIGSNLDFLYDLRGKRGDLLKAAKAVEWDKDTILDRDALIKYIEHSRLQDELRKRVLDKWEAIEDDIKVDRSSKYGV